MSAPPIGIPAGTKAQIPARTLRTDAWWLQPLITVASPLGDTTMVTRYDDVVAVLGLVVTDALYTDHPELPEGQLAKLRAACVDSFLPAAFTRPVACSETFVETTSLDTPAGAGHPARLAVLAHQVLAHQAGHQALGLRRTEDLHVALAGHDVLASRNQHARDLWHEADRRVALHARTPEGQLEPWCARGIRLPLAPWPGHAAGT